MSQSVYIPSDTNLFQTLKVVFQAKANTNGCAQVTSQEIQDYCRGFAQKMACLISNSGDVEGQELSSLGAKEAVSEVEKFINANTQELAKDKWLCPLSGKKFKGPEFVRKHIFNKHAEKVEEVKKEVSAQFRKLSQFNLYYWLIRIDFNSCGSNAVQIFFQILFWSSATFHIQ